MTVLLIKQNKSKLYESYYYREIRNGRNPLPESIYLSERANGRRRKNGTYLAPTYEERLGFPRRFGKFLKGKTLDKPKLEAYILELADSLDNQSLNKSKRNYLESRLRYYLNFLTK